MLSESETRRLHTLEASLREDFRYKLKMRWWVMRSEGVSPKLKAFVSIVTLGVAMGLIFLAALIGNIWLALLSSVILTALLMAFFPWHMVNRKITEAERKLLSSR